MKKLLLFIALVVPAQALPLVELEAEIKESFALGYIERPSNTVRMYANPASRSDTYNFESYDEAKKAAAREANSTGRPVVIVPVIYPSLQ